MVRLSGATVNFGVRAPTPPPARRADQPEIKTAVCRQSTEPRRAYGRWRSPSPEAPNQHYRPQLVKLEDGLDPPEERGAITIWLTPLIVAIDFNTSTSKHSRQCYPNAGFRRRLTFARLWNPVRLARCAGFLFPNQGYGLPSSAWSVRFCVSWEPSAPNTQSHPPPPHPTPTQSRNSYKDIRSSDPPLPGTRR